MATLTGYKKSLVRDIIRYYVNNTKNDYDQFIGTLVATTNQPIEQLTDEQWLARQCMKILEKNEITINDCIENKDTIRKAIVNKDSKQEGEFYTPEVWALEGHKYLREMLGDMWGKAYIWDASVGTGNLLKDIDYPHDKIFASTLLEEDIKLVQYLLPAIESFQLDFLNGIDIEGLTEGFTSKLPQRLQEVLKNGEPLVFFMNPPYKVQPANSTDVGNHMIRNGLSKEGMDLFHQFIYRMIMLKNQYNMENYWIAMYGPTTLYQSNMLIKLADLLKSNMNFVTGMTFAIGEFSNTEDSVEWVVGYTCWESKELNRGAKDIYLPSKVQDMQGNVQVLGGRIYKPIEMDVHEWGKPKYTGTEELIYLPELSSYSILTGKTVKTPSSSLGSVMGSNYVTRGTRRACLTTLPVTMGVPLTEENFWRQVASWGARRSYAGMSNAFNNSQYYSKPSEAEEGYWGWVYNSLPLFLFDTSNYMTSYRQLEFEGQNFDFMNRLFPLSAQEVAGILGQPNVDANIITDYNAHRAENGYIVSVIEQVKEYFSEEAKDFFEYCMELQRKGFNGTVRAESGYKDWTVAWDAGLSQLMRLDGMYSDEDIKRYDYLQKRLKDSLQEGVFRYGFIVDTTEELSTTTEEPTGGIK